MMSENTDDCDDAVREVRARLYEELNPKAPAVPYESVMFDALSMVGEEEEEYNSKTRQKNEL